jgi:hypothetical protein
VIDFLIVIYKNYDLMYYQSKHFARLYEAYFQNKLRNTYRLIFVDNTPPEFRKPINYGLLTENCYVFINDAQDNTHDGASQGSAIDFGRQYCTSEIVCVMDSDFIFTNYIPIDGASIISEFRQDLSLNAIGTEYYDGESDVEYSWKYITSQNKDLFKNIPCCFCIFLKQDLLNAATWVVTHEESSNKTNTFIETGWRIRNHILQFKLKTKTFEGYQLDTHQGTEYPSYFLFNSKLIGFHLQRGSHRNSEGSIDSISSILKDYYLKI